VLQVLRAAFKQFASITKTGLEEKEVARAKSVYILHCGICSEQLLTQKEQPFTDD